MKSEEWVIALEYGGGKYTYTLVEGWAKLTEGESLVDVVGISIDEDDRVYAFGRSRRPLIIFDSDYKTWPFPQDPLRSASLVVTTRSPGSRNGIPQ